MKRRTFVSSCTGVVVLSAGCVQDDPGDAEGSSETDTPDGSPTPAADSSADAGEPVLGAVETGAVETAPETVTLDDAVERSVDVENEGSESATVLVTLTAVAPDEERFLDDDAGHETVTVDPGAPQELTLSWSPTAEVPEGEYDLLVELWTETDLDNRETQLDDRTEENAITVEKPTGTLTVVTVPTDATVALDERVIEDETVERPVGTYEVTALHGEYGERTESVTIEEDEPTEIKIDLTEDE